MRRPATRYAQPPLHAASLRLPRSAAMIILVSLVFLAVFTGIALVAAETSP
jgi:hypothetical protein